MFRKKNKQKQLYYVWWFFLVIFNTHTFVVDYQLSILPKTLCIIYKNHYLRYVAGYLANKLLRKFECGQCKSELTLEEVILDSEDELLILHRSFATTEGVSHLQAPSPLMVKVTDTVLASFVANFDRVKTLSGIKATLVDLTRKEISKLIPAWFETNSQCKVHREFIINFCVKLKIIKHILWETQVLRLPRSKTPYPQKWKKLRHL